ncbi:MAG: diaminopimelate decarboxylase [Flavobacterium sp. BFFFF2]|nr:MAG: diaminopimelate decarboxylase [Flavobacterium sp. BFFFF2]
MSTTQVPLLELAETYSCPLYVYDAAVIEKQYNRLVNAFADIADFRIHYAMKALSSVAILQYFKQLGSGLDTVSLQEVQLGLHAGFSPDEIVFTPSGVSTDELEAVMRLGVSMNIDNLKDLEWMGTHYPEVPVGVRINPHVMAGGHANISVGHIDSKFGISVHQLPLVHRIRQNTGMTIHGLHMHTGSDILDVGVFLHAAEILFEAALTFPDLACLDFGSGFKVAYGANDTETDIEELGRLFAERFAQFVTDYGQSVKLMIEPGKFLVSESGYFLAKVNGVKQTTSSVFAQLDSGFNHLIRPMLYGAQHPIYNLSNQEGKMRFYTVVGYICETDTFAANRKIEEIHEGDILAFANAGAYGFSMASNYNSRYKPAEVLWYKGKAQLIRAHETFEDLIKNQFFLKD